MSYQLIIHPKAEKEIKNLPKHIGGEIIKAIYSLSEQPRPHGYKKLSDYKSERVPKKTCYRIRVSDYRVVYTIEQEVITITIVMVKHRKEVYKKP